MSFTCPKCKKDTLKHRHDCAYGFSGTHMSGTERFECPCGFSCWDAYEGEKLGLIFTLDIITDIERDMYDIGMYDEV